MTPSICDSVLLLLNDNDNKFYSEGERHDKRHCDDDPWVPFDFERDKGRNNHLT